MESDAALTQHAERLERQARLRWLWHALAIAGMVLLGLAALTSLVVLILAAGAVTALGATMALLAETAARKARLLRAQLA